MKTIGLATLGRDAEMRYTPGGDAVANLSLAVNYYKKGAENDRATQWIDATLWGKQAEALVQYMVKGSRHCFVLSDIHTETFQRQDGTEGFKLVARVDSVELGPRVANDNQDGGSRAPAPAPRPQSRAPAATPGQPQRPASGFDDMDDDIPF